MRRKKVSKSKSEVVREPFTTIDDLTETAEDLAFGLRRLGEYKYPLDIRCGTSIKIKEVEKSLSGDRESRQIRGSGRTYFFDLEKTHAGKGCLRITESRKGSDDKFERNSIFVFPEGTKEFANTVNEMVAKLD